MDIRSKSLHALIDALKRCRKKNKYMLLLNELLSLFPLHAEKSLKLCLKSQIKKYTLVKDANKDNKTQNHFIGFRMNQKRMMLQNEAYFSDSAYMLCKREEEKCESVVVAQPKRIKVSFYSRKKKITKMHFFVVKSKEKEYIVLKNFCSCYYFADKVLCNRSDITCKHVVSVILAKCFNKIPTYFLEESLFFEWYLRKLQTEI